jgi:uncharacterized Zn-binding protein involved in type VI secretion
MKITARIQTVALATLFALPVAYASAADFETTIQEAKTAISEIKKNNGTPWALKGDATASWGIKTEQKVGIYSTENVIIDAEKAAEMGDEAQAMKLANLAKFQAETALKQAIQQKDAGPRKAS